MPTVPSTTECGNSGRPAMGRQNRPDSCVHLARLRAGDLSALQQVEQPEQFQPAVQQPARPAPWARRQQQPQPEQQPQQQAMPPGWEPEPEVEQPAEQQPQPRPAQWARPRPEQSEEQSAPAPILPRAHADTTPRRRGGIKRGGAAAGASRPSRLSRLVRSAWYQRALTTMRRWRQTGIQPDPADAAAAAHAMAAAAAAADLDSHQVHLADLGVDNLADLNIHNLAHGDPARALARLAAECEHDLLTIAMAAHADGVSAHAIREALAIDPETIDIASTCRQEWEQAHVRGATIRDTPGGIRELISSDDQIHDALLMARRLGITDDAIRAWYQPWDRHPDQPLRRPPYREMRERHAKLTKQAKRAQRSHREQRMAAARHAWHVALRCADHDAWPPAQRKALRSVRRAPAAILIASYILGGRRRLSISYLAEAVGCDVETARRAVKQLIATGLIKRDPSHSRGTGSLISLLRIRVPPAALTAARQAQQQRAAANYWRDSDEWRQLRRQRLDLDGHHCVQCGGPGTIVDHVDPVGDGGPALPAVEALQTLCGECEREKTSLETTARAARRKTTSTIST